MRKILYIAFFILSWNLAAFSQSDQNLCERISLIEPASAASFGENLLFSVVIPAELDKEDLKYIWDINKGKIVKGQGTPQIEVSTKDLDYTVVSATVSISGLLKNCAADYFGMGIVAIEFNPIPRDEFGKLPDKDIRARLDPFASDILAEKNSTAWVVNSGPEEFVMAREQLIAFILKEKRKIDLSRIVFARDSSEISIRTVFWIIPEGAAMNQCENCEIIKGSDIKFDSDEFTTRLNTSICPIISISEPAVAVAPGENITFKADISGDFDTGTLGFQWKISAGKIVSGQDTSEIEVATEDLERATVEAIVSVYGLAESCTSTYSGAGIVTDRGHDFALRDEFSDLSHTELNLRITQFFEEIRKETDYIGVIVIYGSLSQKKKHEKQIHKLLLKLKIEDSLLKIIDGGIEPKIRTRLWIVGKETGSEWF